MGARVERLEPVSVRKAPCIDQALWIMTHGAGFGKYQWRSLKSSLKDLIVLPSWEKMSHFWKLHILADIKSLWRDIEGEDRQFCGVCLDPVQFLPLYLKRFLERLNLEGHLPDAGNYRVEFKVGSDGGRHAWYKWLAGQQPQGTSMTISISLYDCTLLSMESLPGTPEYTWTEQKPNSDRVTRVLAVVMAEESEVVVKNTVIWLSKQQESLSDGFNVEFDGMEYTFFPSFKERHDKKMDRLLTGVGDGCDSCTAPRSLWNNMVAIEAGFAMDRSVESTQAMWKGLDKNKDGEVIKRRGDYAERLGLCHEPNIVRPTLSFTITHKWMCAANHKVKIALHVMVGHYKWVEDASIKPRIKEAKELLQKALKPGQVVGGSVRENIGVAYGYPDAKGCGGTTTTGEVARKMFCEEELRSRIVKLVPQEFRPAMEKILFQDMILLRLMSCDYLLLPEKINRLCKEQMRLQVEDIGSWVNFPETMHEFYAHLAEMIEINENRGLKRLSEENLEALHKQVRRIRETKARLQESSANATDILTRVNVRSDPVVGHFEPKVSCKICHREGHSKMSCDYSEKKSGDNMSYEDWVFWQYVDPCDCPDGYSYV